jgi:hypothetical protein
MQVELPEAFVEATVRIETGGPLVESVTGEGPVAGFVLDLRKIWEGL